MAIKLGEYQRKFTYNLGKLIVAIYDVLGYEATLGEGYDDDGVGHMKGSTHYIRLGQDINLFKDGVFLEGEAARVAHSKVHDLWDMMGGAKRIERDLNHYSYEWEGRR